VIVDVALEQALRSLKLSGMLHTLEARLAQARAGELGHIEFLQVLCHDEIGRRESQAIARRIQGAKFDQIEQHVRLLTRCPSVRDVSKKRSISAQTIS
jgi:DNA replication protein DnaC